MADEAARASSSGGVNSALGPVVAPAVRRASGKKRGRADHNRSMDFLVEPAVTLVNLVPDDGRRCPADALGPITCSGSATDDALTVAWDLPEQDLARRDLRLAEPLDAAGR